MNSRGKHESEQLIEGKITLPTKTNKQTKNRVVGGGGGEVNREQIN